MAVEIGSQEYQTYASDAEAHEYLAADFGAAVWRAEDDEDQHARALVTATRILDRMAWAGDKADAAQALAWPRTGTGITGVEDDAIPQPIIDASILLAKLIHAGSAVDGTPSTAQSIKRQRAGSVEQEFFRSFDDPTRLPTEVHELIGPYLAGSGGVGGAIASGVCEPTAFHPGYGLSGPY